MSETLKLVLQKANAAIVQGDFEGFLGHCTEDTEWTFVGDRTLKGKAAIRRWMTEAYREPPSFQVRHLIADGEFVTAVGDIMVRDEGGQAVRHAYCDVWRFRGGLMAELQAFVIRSEP